MPDSSPYLVYLAAFFMPFVQEDAAVFGTATASVTGLGHTVPLFLILWAGLVCSDIWKYWIGWGALKIPRFAHYAEKKHVANLRERVLDHPLVALLIARFIPGTRIPTYVAFGFFRMNYPRFCCLVAITALLYITIVFGLTWMFGEILGKKIIWVMPLIGFTYVLIALKLVLDRRKNNNPPI
ncbi:MAG: VTT domain-containing protein [Hyphomonadaceae bacterium]|nr:VTT domain-containing protein [Hyphomonadaceae bacterium]